MMPPAFASVMLSFRPTPPIVFASNSRALTWVMTPAWELEKAGQVSVHVLDATTTMFIKSYYIL